ncbi:heterokaryon incompatibility protein-domain-containing protein, partial [Lasiosphaeris hirsuta]
PLPRRPAPDDISQPGDRLCDVCSALKLKPERFVVGPGDPEWKQQQSRPDDPNIPLGSVGEVASRTHCPLCRLVLTTLGGARGVPTHDDLTGEALRVDLSWGTDGPAPDANAPWHRLPEIRVLRPYALTESGGFPRSVGLTLNLFPEITLVADDAPATGTSAASTGSDYFVRAVRPDAIDFGVVRRWLALCSLHHGATCRKSASLKELSRSHPTLEIDSFRCIDTENSCLVTPPTRCRYAALSYVWGAPDLFTTLRENVRDLEVAGSFQRPEYRDRVPLTIRDAMRVVREIGMRYLWVDSLCIVQDVEHREKVKHILLMDAVYSAAELVIIAAGSASANEGIAGIDPGSRGFRQPIEQMAPGFRLAYKTRWQDGIPASRYYKRGWTFQESHFATRSLVFLDGRVVFRCQGTDVWEEHLAETPDQIRGRSLRGGGGPFAGGDDIGETEGLIQTYSERELTYPADIYSAFAGVSRQLVYRLDTDLCHGLPTVYFDWFLLWGPLADQTRRPAPDQLAPSWSWAGWVGSTFPRIWDWYNRSIRRIRKAIRQRTWILWHQRVASSPAAAAAAAKPPSLLVRRRTHPEAKPKPARNFYGSRFQPDRFPGLDCSRVEPTPDIVLADPPCYLDDILSYKNKGSGLLQFWTVSLALRLGEPVSKASDVGPTHSRRRLGLFGRGGSELGVVEVPASWCEANAAAASGNLPLAQQEREFILLCEGRDERAEGGRIDDDEGWRYKVMLLDWVGKGGVRTAKGAIDGGLMYAERVAIGSVGKADLAEGLGEGPVWKEIILG